MNLTRQEESEWLFDKNEFDRQDEKSSHLYNPQTKLVNKKVQNQNYFPKGEVVGAPKLKAPGTVAWAN